MPGLTVHTASDVDATASFLTGAMRDLAGITAGARLLDWGCGQGRLVDAFTRFGFDAWGCDLPATHASGTPVEKASAAAARLRQIEREPYRLPFDDQTFDVVVSTSVLEHAQNKEECFREIRRVLKPGGIAMHLFPSKWYIPFEPHIYVPLVNWFWPWCPRPWLWLWAKLGLRNEFQKGLPSDEVVRLNARYCREGLSYWGRRRYEQLASSVFGHFEWAGAYYIAHAPGGFPRMMRRMRAYRLGGLLSRDFRMAFLITRKTPG